MMSGSGGAGGYDYQADGYAYIAAHLICRHSLGWFDDINDTPTAVASETGGPGDDLGIETQDGNLIEIQAKHGLTKGDKFDEAMLRMGGALATNPRLRCVLLVDSTTSGTIREDFRTDILRVAEGRTDALKEITLSVLELFRPTGGIDPVVFRRFRVIVRNLADGEEGRASGVMLLREVMCDPRQVDTAWEILAKDGHRQMGRRGRRDAVALVQFLSTRIPLKPDTSNVTVAAEVFRRWQIETFGRFFVPGVGVSLPINQAWIGLRLLGEEKRSPDQDNSVMRLVQSYHEWERLADNLTT